MNSYFIASSVFREKRKYVLSWLYQHNADHEDVVLLINDSAEQQSNVHQSIDVKSDGSLEIVDLSEFDTEKRNAAMEKARYSFLSNSEKIRGMLFVCNDLFMLEIFHALAHHFYLMPRSTTSGELQHVLRSLQIKAFLARWYLRFPFFGCGFKAVRFVWHGIRYVIRYFGGSVPPLPEK